MERILRWARRLSRDERGSVMAVVMALMSILVLLGMGIGEMAHASYIIRSLQLAADRAAEAGGIAELADGTRLRYSYVRMRVRQWRYYRYNPHTVCDDYDWADPDGIPDSGDEYRYCSRSHIEWDVGTEYRTVIKEGKEEEFVNGAWRDKFDCYSGTPWRHNGTWGCEGEPWVVSPERDNRWIEFTGMGINVARDTFKGNWKDRPTAWVNNIFVTQSDSNRSTDVTVRATIKPIFFKFLPNRNVTIHSKSLVQMKPFRL